MTAVLKQRNDMFVDAKRIIINEELENITEQILDDDEIKKTLNKNGNCTKMQNQIKWEDEQFWQNIPNPLRTIKEVKAVDAGRLMFNVNINEKEMIDINLLKIQAIQGTSKEGKSNEPSNCPSDSQDAISDHVTLKKYFGIWKEKLLKRKEEKENVNKINETRQKLEDFIICLERKKNNVSKPKIELNSKKENEKCKNINYGRKNSFQGSFDNRYKAQQQIIENQKLKLEEQARLIEALKMGKLEEDLQRSLESAKINIREIFAKCSAKLKCKVAPIFDENHVPTYKFDIISNKAPKIIKEMEKRAFERSLRRELILERKKLLEEQRKKQLQLEIERKKAQDEEERKKNLEAIKEKRRRDLEIQMIRQRNKEKYLRNLEIADNLYKTKLLRLAFFAFKKIVWMREKNELKSEAFRRQRLLKNCWQKWLKYVEDKYAEKSKKAIKMYEGKLLRITFVEWYKLYRLGIQNLQVAEDFYDYKLQNKMFICWQDYTCKMLSIEEKNMKKAERHYKRYLLVHYFYLWQTLPAVLQLERAKEEKKRKWREKVWEILPDYSYPTEE